MFSEAIPPLKLPEHLACHDCDAIYRSPELGEGERVLCPRCGANLFNRRRNTIHNAAAMVVASAIFFVSANMYTFLSMRSDYRESYMVLGQSATGLIQENFNILGVAVGLFTLVAPAVVIGGLLYLLLPLLQGRRLPGALWLCRWVYTTRRWNMVEVFLVGVLVSMLKLGKLATLTLGMSFWAFVGLILCLAATLSSIDERELWARLEAAHP